MAAVGVEISPLPKPFEKSAVDFGAELSGIDLEHIDDESFQVIREALYNNNVVLIKGQHNLSPKAQYELTRLFDPEASTYSHGSRIDKRSVLHKDLTTLPSQPQVQVIGHGAVVEFEGLENLKLTHPHHKTFHKHPHIDSAMYNLDPPLVTSLFACRVPKGRRQICRYDDGTGDELEVPLGTTAFISGYRMFELLSEEDQEFVKTSTIEYSPHPYIWMSKAKARSNGLGLFSEGLELSEDQLPEIEEEKIRRYPMAWKNPVTGKFAMMVYPTPARRIHLKDGTVMEDLKEVRELIYRLQRPAISPQYVYPHDWEEGDLVLFNNHGVMHSIVGAFAENEVRLFRQCNMAASRPPQGSDC
ncbi:alpha-ketoglutarate dependent xanthine dioxygenase [Colletotrichum lupini]|nr:alpha-ketoglutarate dependent xanthine dioxygenase [Colletotrichum lupini]